MKILGSTEGGTVEVSLPVAWGAAEGPAMNGDGAPPVVTIDGGTEPSSKAKTLDGAAGKSLGRVGGEGHQ
ncbi:UNVERIFIED_CONTAM: hypothetical protein Slati_2468600 [Sesamum latifolium]|uniref:Uncharacterized protein n=1 Tax=Sesamum latifolium TaxID=2727402 RepID=A0AAW2WIQ3_9LAMI